MGKQGQMDYTRYIKHLTHERTDGLYQQLLKLKDETLEIMLRDWYASKGFTFDLVKESLQKQIMLNKVKFQFLNYLQRHINNCISNEICYQCGEPLYVKQKRSEEIVYVCPNGCAWHKNYEELED